MALKDFLQEINDEVKTITSSDFKVEIIETKYVPNTDDKDLTFENFDTKTKKCKMIETCVLYTDIRKSTELSLQHYPTTLSKLYSAFSRSMVKCARYYGGHVRNIIGDRVMVIFDSYNCVSNAINTAILLNTTAKYILNKHFKNNEVQCGIGIDYGKMLVTKVGTVKKGVENQEYKYLTWLGKPANVASKLTDNANKEHKGYREFVNAGFQYPWNKDWTWVEQSYGQFLDNLENVYLSNTLKHKDQYFKAFNKHSFDITTKPILISEKVYDEYKKANPDAKGIKEGWWSKQAIKVLEYNGTIYGADINFTDINEVK